MLIDQINNMLWSIYFLIPLLAGISIFFSYKTNFIQFRTIKTFLRTIFHPANYQNEEKQINSLQAFMIGLGARVGTGNMSGVALALVIGGPGAIFWMWSMAIFGASTAFIESTIAQLYKVSDDSIGFKGGPAYYINNKLRKKNLAKIFAITITFGYTFAMVGLQTNTVANAVKNEVESYFTLSNENLPLILIGLSFSLFTGYVIFSGTKKIAIYSTKIVSVMTVIYLLMMLSVVSINIEHLFSVFKLIITNALSWQAITGGTFGIMVSTGFKRGLVSNEAGQGTAANAAASATTSHPVGQGIIQAMGVFIDTLVISTATAFIILLADIPLEGTDGIYITQQALVVTLGENASILLTITLFFFAISTILGVYYYGQSNYRFLFKNQKIKYYNIAIVIFIFFSAIFKSEFVWAITDLSAGIMVLINLYALYKLYPYALIALKDFEKQRKSKSTSETIIFDSSKYEETKELEIWSKLDDK